jgi:hypothetical protein
MTQPNPNAEKLRRLFSAFEVGGSEAAGRLIPEVFEPEVEFNPLPAGEAGGRTYRGLDGVIGFFDELHEEFQEVHYDWREFYPLSEDIVLVFTQLVAIPAGSSVPLRQELSLVYEFAGGLAQRVTAYDSPAEALEAAERGHAGA